MFATFPDSILTALQAKVTDLPTHFEKVLQVAFYSSLGVEEGRPTTFTLVLCPPESLSPEFPGDWDVFRFQPPRPFVVREVVKLAPATDPQRVLIGVHEVDGVLHIWGLLATRGNQKPIGRRAYQESWWQRAQFGPKFLKVHCAGSGFISVHSGTKLLVEFRAGNLVTHLNSVFSSGLVSNRLKDLEIEYWNWLARILRTIQDTGHGGTLLIAPDNEPSSISLKYQCQSTALNTSLTRLLEITREINCAIKQVDNSSHINELKTLTHQLLSAFDCDVDIQDDLQRNARTIASLAAVDGAVLLGRSFRLLGFGAKIDTPSSLPNVRKAKEPEGSELEQMDTSERGNRLISAISFCNVNPGAVAFVCSQDGPVSAVLKHENNVVVWEDIETVPPLPQS